MIFTVVRHLSATGRAQKRAIVIGYDLAAMAIALWAAFSMRLGELYFPADPLVFVSAAGSMAVGIFALYRLQVYRMVLRYFDMRPTSRIFLAAALAATAWVILIYYLRPSIVVSGVEIAVPRSVGFIYCGFLFLLLFMGRYLMSFLLAGAMRETGDYVDGGRKRVAIYGANAAGISVAESMRGSRQYELKAFVEDDAALHGQIIAGVPIHAPKALPTLARSAMLDEVFLAMPNATRSQRLSAISRLNKLNLKVLTVPAPEEIVSGRFSVTDVRPINVNDLLRRDPVEPLTELILQAVQGHSILITGAGGSIGSEICRQIVRAGPKRMVLLDHSEFALYSIEQQLEEMCQSLGPDERPQIVPIVGSMLSDLLVRRAIAEHEVDTIYHAAAYKHVPLLEHNEVVGVENNVIGTLVLARAAYEAKLTRFTMISTDKAVRPESVMGASKRAAELIVQAFADEPDCATRFGIVRFGNVLDSSGSVVQRFREQIRRGGPVTVTHKDVTRFFMSIPEATQLVMQASAMAERGEVFVLDMGEPVKIYDLAQNMIALSGMTVRNADHPHGDIEIVYTGLRPGEKLYEELFVGADALETPHPRIKMAPERSAAFAELDAHIASLRQAIEAADRQLVRETLQKMIAHDAHERPGAAAAFPHPADEQRQAAE